MLTGVCGGDTSAMSLSLLFTFLNKFTSKETTLNFIEVVDSKDVISEESLVFAPIHFTLYLTNGFYTFFVNKCGQHYYCDLLMFFVAI